MGKTKLFRATPSLDEKEVLLREGRKVVSVPPERSIERSDSNSLAIAIGTQIALLALVAAVAVPLITNLVESKASASVAAETPLAVSSYIAQALATDAQARSVVSNATKAWLREEGGQLVRSSLDKMTALELSTQISLALNTDTGQFFAPTLVDSFLQTEQAQTMIAAEVSRVASKQLPAALSLLGSGLEWRQALNTAIAAFLVSPEAHALLENALREYLASTDGAPSLGDLTAKAYRQLLEEDPLFLQKLLGDYLSSETGKLVITSAVTAHQSFTEAVQYHLDGALRELFEAPHSAEVREHFLSLFLASSVPLHEKLSVLERAYLGDLPGLRLRALHLADPSTWDQAITRRLLMAACTGDRLPQEIEAITSLLSRIPASCTPAITDTLEYRASLNVGVLVSLVSEAIARSRDVVAPRILDVLRDWPEADAGSLRIALARLAPNGLNLSTRALLFDLLLDRYSQTDASEPRDFAGRVGTVETFSSGQMLRCIDGNYRFIPNALGATAIGNYVTIDSPQDDLFPMRTLVSLSSVPDLVGRIRVAVSKGEVSSLDTLCAILAERLGMFPRDARRDVGSIDEFVGLVMCVPGAVARLGCSALVVSLLDLMSEDACIELIRLQLVGQECADVTIGAYGELLANLVKVRDRGVLHCALMRAFSPMAVTNLRKAAEGVLHESLATYASSGTPECLRNILIAIEPAVGRGDPSAFAFVVMLIKERPISLTRAGIAVQLEALRVLRAAPSILVDGAIDASLESVMAIGALAEAEGNQTEVHTLLIEAEHTITTLLLRAPLLCGRVSTLLENDDRGLSFEAQDHLAASMLRAGEWSVISFFLGHYTRWLPNNSETLVERYGAWWGLVNRAGIDTAELPNGRAIGVAIDEARIEAEFSRVQTWMDLHRSELDGRRAAMTQIRAEEEGL